jgi:hypothetical protein
VFPSLVQALLKRRVALEESLNANRAKLARSRAAKRLKLELSKAVRSTSPSGSTQKKQEETEEPVARPVGREGARKAEVGRFVTEEVAEAERHGIGGLQIRSRNAEASSNEEGGTRVDQAFGGAGSSEGIGFAPGTKEDSQTTGHIEDAEAGTNAGRRASAAGKRTQDALSAGGLELSTVLQKGKGVRQSEGSASKGRCSRLHAEAQGLIQPADVSPGSSKALEMEKGPKSSGGKCPNHADGKEQPSWSADMEADTETESESSQSSGPADAGGGGTGKRSWGVADAKSGRLRCGEVEADVGSGAVRRSSWGGELPGEAKKEEERGSQEGKECSSKLKAVAEDSEVQEGGLAESRRKVEGNASGNALLEHSGPFGQQGNIENDSTEPLDDFVGSPFEMQDGQIGPAPQDAEQSFGRSALEDDFGADRPAGWITAVRNRVTRLSNPGALEKTAGTQADGKVGAGTQGSGKASRRRAAGKAEGADGINMRTPKNEVEVPADGKHALSTERSGKGSREKADCSDEIPEENTSSTPGSGKREKAAARVRVERADEIIQETEEQAWGGVETVHRRGVNRLGAGLTDRRRHSKGLRPTGSGEENAMEEPEENGNVEKTKDEHAGAERGASLGSGVDREKNTGATSKASLEQGLGLEKGQVQARGGGKHAVEAPAGLLKQDSLVGPAGKKGTRKRLSLAPFKEAVQWMATEGGKEFAAQLRSEVSGRGGAAGCGFGGEEGSARGGKPEMEELLTLAGLGGKDGVFTPSGSAREGRAKQGDEAGRPADVDLAQGPKSAAVTTERLERFFDPHCGDGLPALCGLKERQLVHGDAATVSEGLGRASVEGGGRGALSDGTKKDSAVEMKPVPGALRIVGSDSLTEQQSEQQFTDADAAEGLEASEKRPSGKEEELAAGAFVEGEVLGTVKEAGLERVEDAGLERVEDAGSEGSRGRVPEPVPEKEAPGMLEMNGAKTVGTLRGVPTKAREKGAEKLECDGGAERTEKDGLQTSEKGGLTPLVQPIPPLKALSGIQAERAEKRRPASPVVALERSPELASWKTTEPPLHNDRNRTSSWFGKAVDKISSAFKPQPTTGFKPLALTRSEHPPREVVSNAAQVAQLPKLDTGGGWLEKSRPRTKSWPIWKGPTSNPNLKKVGGSAQKAPLRPAVESWRASGIPPESAAETEGKRSRALESQARRLGRFEESEAVRDWPVGDFLVPSTPPETAGEDIPLKEIDALVNDVPKSGPVDRGERPSDGPESVSPALGQGPLRSVCCLVKQGGPVLWTVILCAGQETRLGVCIEGDKAQRSVFVYDLCRGDEQTEWTSDVLGVIPGVLRPSEDEDQVSFLERVCTT